MAEQPHPAVVTARLTRPEERKLREIAMERNETVSTVLRTLVQRASGPNLEIRGKEQ